MFYLENLDEGVSQYHRQVIIDTVLFSDYLNVVLDEVATDTKIKCPNPSHDDNTPSFFYDDSKGVCNCFGCGLGGSVIELHRTVFSIAESEAIRDLAYRFNIELKYVVKDKDKESRSAVFKRLTSKRKKRDEIGKLDDLNRNIVKYVQHMTIEDRQKYYRILDIINFTGYKDKKDKLINMLYNVLVGR